MAELMLCLDGGQEKFVVVGCGDVTNVEIVSVDFPNAQPRHTTVVIRLMTPDECAVGKKLRQAMIARRVSTNLGSAECQAALAASGYDREESRRTAEAILNDQEEKAKKAKRTSDS